MALFVKYTPLRKNTRVILSTPEIKYQVKQHLRAETSSTVKQKKGVFDRKCALRMKCGWSRWSQYVSAVGFIV